MNKTFFRWPLIALLILFTPLIYIKLQVYITANAAFPVITAFSAKSKTALFSILTIFNLFCAILTAILIALPCSYLAGKHAKMIAVLFIFSALCFPVYVVIQEQEIHTFSAAVILGQIVAIVLSAFIFSEIGSRVATKRQSKATA